MLRKALVILILVGLAASFSLLASALLSAQVQVGENQFVNGTVAISTNPTSALITYNSMAPGDQVTAPLQVNNAGSLNLRYAMTTSVTSGTDQFILAGNFAQANGQRHLRIAQWNNDGSLDSSFPANTDVTYYSHYNQVFALARQPDGKLLVGGWFDLVNGQAHKNFARVNADGTVDAAFNNDTSNRVVTLAVQPDGKILVGGGFATIGGQGHPGLARLNVDGSLDTAFAGFVNGEVDALAIQPDGKIVLGGSFAWVNGVLRWELARLNADGSLDPGFTTAFYSGGGVQALALQANGQIIAGGTFPAVNYVSHPSLVRLNSNGSTDGSFNPSTNGTVNALTVQGDGKIVVGGSFSQVNGVPRNNLARLNADGSLDESFDPNVNGGVNTLVIQSDGRIVFGGSFSQVAGQTHLNLARVNRDGSVDATFYPSVDGSVNTLVTADGLASQLQLTLKSGVTTCSNGGFAADGATLYQGPLSSALFGNPAPGAQTGDRPLVSASSESLCFHAALPLTTGNADQNKSATVSFTFAAEQTANNP